MRQIEETLVVPPLATLWAATRNPAAHRRWDVRFSRVDPVDGAGRFRYAFPVRHLDTAAAPVPAAMTPIRENRVP